MMKTPNTSQTSAATARRIRKSTCKHPAMPIELLDGTKVYPCCELVVAATEVA